MVQCRRAANAVRAVPGRLLPELPSYCFGIVWVAWPLLQCTFVCITSVSVRLSDQIVKAEPWRTPLDQIGVWK